MIELRNRVRRRLGAIEFLDGGHNFCIQKWHDLLGLAAPEEGQGIRDAVIKVNILGTCEWGGELDIPPQDGLVLWAARNRRPIYDAIHVFKDRPGRTNLKSGASIYVSDYRSYLLDISIFRWKRMFQDQFPLQNGQLACFSLECTILT